MSSADQYENLIARYVAAVGNGDAKAVADLYTEDAILLEPWQPPVSGRQAIFELYLD